MIRLNKISKIYNKGKIKRISGFNRHQYRNCRWWTSCDHRHIRCRKIHITAYFSLHWQLWKRRVLYWRYTCKKLLREKACSNPKQKNWNGYAGFCIGGWFFCTSKRHATSWFFQVQSKWEKGKMSESPPSSGDGEICTSPVDKLSGGQKQRVAIARAIVMNRRSFLRTSRQEHLTARLLWKSWNFSNLWMLPGELWLLSHMIWKLHSNAKG